MRHTFVCFTILILSSLILISCGGSKSGGITAYVPPPPPASKPAPTPAPAPEPAPAPILVPTQAQIDQALALERAGGTIPKFTSTDISVAAYLIANEADSLLVSDELTWREGVLGDYPAFRSPTSCAGDTCTTDFAGSLVTISAAEWTPSTLGTENIITPIMRHRGVDLASVTIQESLTIQEEDTPYTVFGYGGWMEHNYFFSRTLKSDGIDGLETVGSFSVGKATGTNPTSGSATWKGAMVGVSELSEDLLNSQVKVQGDATLSIADFMIPEIDIRFTNVFEPHGGDHLSNMTWQRVPLTGGSFHTGARTNQISGIFYGPNHEEVGGVFERNLIVGSFGAKRE